ncbi:MAG: hydrogenase maturation nickel metallochaperone HypA [Phycisphaerales bacterium]|nr:hydrogenase maturation nickel metallochaperone HypA [Phycisphaerales bacterium]
MHEAAVTEALIDQVRALLPQGGRLVACRVEVGALEHVDASVLTTLWSAMVRSTELADAELVVESVALSVRCAECGREHAPADPAILLCPGCGAVRPEILAGTGIVLRALEIEESG